MLARSIANTPVSPAPIIIIGHWRTGTSFLHHLLSRGNFAYLDPVVAGIPSEAMILGTSLRPILEMLLPSDRLVDSMPVRPDSPQEDEVALANMTHLAFHHGLYFPTQLQRVIDESLFFQHGEEARAEWSRVFRYFVTKLSIRSRGKQLLLKNPAYTCRVALIRQVFPSAKFIHIIRNPYEVYPSMKNFYEKLLSWLALESYEHIDIDSILLLTYKRMMNRLDSDVGHIPASHLVEVRYEGLVADPMCVLKGIYEQLELRGFEIARAQFCDYLSSVRAYKRNSYEYASESFRLVERHWGDWIERWGYAPPATTPG